MQELDTLFSVLTKLGEGGFARKYWEERCQLRTEGGHTRVCKECEVNGSLFK